MRLSAAAGGVAIVAAMAATTGRRRTATSAKRTIPSPSPRTMSAADVVRTQLLDLTRGRTRTAYQLASPENRRRTAAPTGHNQEQFDHMVRSSFRPMLEADDFAMWIVDPTTVRVLLFQQERMTAAYEFSLSPQYGRDDHRSLGRFALPAESGFLRTDSVVRLDSGEAERTWRAVRDRRRTQLRTLCFGDRWDDDKLSHSFGVDETHNVCCRLGPRARSYADESGNPIGTASRDVNPDGEFRHWSTCIGSNVCSAYAERFKDGTRPRFATDPHLTKMAVDIAPTAHCEARARHDLNTGPHATPGVSTRGDPRRCSRAPRILGHSKMDAWLETHTHTRTHTEPACKKNLLT